MPADGDEDEREENDECNDPWDASFEDGKRGLVRAHPAGGRGAWQDIALRGHGPVEAGGAFGRCGKSRSLSCSVTVDLVAVANLRRGRGVWSSPVSPTPEERIVQSVAGHHHGASCFHASPSDEEP